MDKDKRNSSSHVDSELEQMETRYAKRKQHGASSWKRRYYQRIRVERNVHFRDMLTARFSDLGQVRCIEVGAAGGGNLSFFHDVGVPWSQISANELLPERIADLRANHPDLTVFEGNALDIQTEPFDIILISAVLSSILDVRFRKELARHLLSMLSERGCILWYDFCYQNPINQDVSGIKEEELKQLFDTASSIEMRRVTLTPPVALLVGPLYSAFAWIPFLKSHIAAAIDAPKR